MTLPWPSESPHGDAWRCNNVWTNLYNIAKFTLVMYYDMVKTAIAYEWPQLRPSRSFGIHTDECTTYVILICILAWTDWSSAASLKLIICHEMLKTTIEDEWPWPSRSYWYFTDKHLQHDALLCYNFSTGLIQWCQSHTSYIGQRAILNMDDFDHDL